MTETKAERVAYAQKLKFDLAIRDQADRLTDGWVAANGSRRPLSRAYELLHRDDVGRAVVQSCIESVRAYDPGTMSRPTDGRRVAQLYCLGKLDLSELPDPHRFLNSRTLAALVQGVLTSRGYAAATGTRCTIAAHRWQTLQPDFKESMASVDGKTIFYGIEVDVAKSAAVPSKRKKTSVAEVKRWYEARVLFYSTNGCRPSREEDLAAAKAEFGSEHRALLKTLRPVHWKTGGRPRTPKNSAR